MPVQMPLAQGQQAKQGFGAHFKAIPPALSAEVSSSGPAPMPQEPMVGLTIVTESSGFPKAQRQPSAELAQH